MDQSLDRLLLNSGARRLLQTAISKPPHGLLLSGPSGVGLYTIAGSLAETMTDRPADIHLIKPDEKGTIGIGLVQALYHTVKIKQPDQQVTIIDDADSMTAEAQNALLKMLEEPPSHQIFVLTTHRLERLLPTIKSRLQQLYINPVDRHLTESLIIKRVTDRTRQAQINFLAAGLPAETYRLLEKESYFKDQSELMTDAKQFIEADIGSRLIYIGKGLADRSSCEKFLVMTGRLAAYSYQKNHAVGRIAAIEAVLEAAAAIRSNGNIKLHMTKLSLSLG